jgi:D-glycero-D-manno-heptose 1,7-bisphosphate phosphatase
MSGASVDHGPGIFSKRLSTTNYAEKPCLFLDRDGVVVEETHYLHRTEDVTLINGVGEAMAKANAMGVAVVMVTNQAGIGRGYYTWQDFEVVQRHILGACGSLGGRCDMILACAYHCEALAPYNREAHPWRKPAPGMLFEAARVLDVDLSRSHIVGDTLADLEAGAQAGLPGGTLVLTGHGGVEWRDRGEAAFARYKKSGSFKARLARNGAEAIRDWLADLTPDVSVV